MGKSLRGKECGKGICQRKDGLYSARFVSSEGKRQVKCFSSLPEARNWLEDAKYADTSRGCVCSAGYDGRQSGLNFGSVTSWET